MCAAWLRSLVVPVAPTVLCSLSVAQRVRLFPVMGGLMLVPNGLMTLTIAPRGRLLPGVGALMTRYVVQGWMWLGAWLQSDLRLIRSLPAFLYLW